jgi:hypothetical protein
MEAGEPRRTSTPSNENLEAAEAYGKAYHSCLTGRG